MGKKISQFIELSRKRGRHWFDPETLRFFNSKYGSLRGDRYFISSEKAPYNPRKWSIRKVNWKTGGVKNVGEFQQFGTQRQAENRLKEILKLRKVV